MSSLLRPVEKMACLGTSNAVHYERDDRESCWAQLFTTRYSTIRSEAPVRFESEAVESSTIDCVHVRRELCINGWLPKWKDVSADSCKIQLSLGNERRSKAVRKPGRMTKKRDSDKQREQMGQVYGTVVRVELPSFFSHVGGRYCSA